MFSISVAAALNNEVIAGVVHDPINRLTFSADTHDAWHSVDGAHEHKLLPTPKTEPTEDRLNLMTSYPWHRILGAPELCHNATNMTTPGLRAEHWSGEHR